MTEYGRGRSPEPWHPEDPLYGDQVWSGHEAQQGQMSYGGGPQQQYPQEPQYQEPQYQQPSYPQQGPHDPYAQQQQAQHQQQQQHSGQHQGYAPQQAHPQQAHPQQAHPQQYVGQPQQQPTYAGQNWDTGQGQYAAAVQADPYVGADPYAQQTVGAYPGEAPDLYTTEEAYPPPVPPGRRHLEPEPADDLDEEPDTSFFSGEGGGDDDGDEPPGRRSGRSKGGKPKKRSGTACLLAAVVILGVVGGGGYYGYSYLKARFGATEDFSGEGSGETVDVEIPKGAGLGQMGRILKEAGVVASAQAFVDAANANPKGKAIQPGIYPMKQKMSGAAAVALMVDPSKLNVLTIAEGMRSATVYQAIDRKLGKPEGSTREIAEREFKNLGLPAWATDNPKVVDPLEGFLYPMRYDLSKDSTPESLLKQMVKNATDKYTELGIEGKAKELGLENPLQVVTVASLVNAEGKNHDDFRKMSEVVYNRLKKNNYVTNQKLEFDSTYNYIKGKSDINFSLKEARAFDNPYNTHFVKGLPPGPIGNPGADALTATLTPDHGGWMFFVSVDGDKTTFTKTYEEHQKLADEFQERQKQKNGG
ncbi:endolytic transglycosylase MltG [Streptomyces sp. APSN-46.1]|uniref:endolytic transglycosylase MltG n=1 Tax=Streptomyces sp. APSN-46.1 TaxID=2929049 RepID=UPI001FB3E10A|nr:endolytic transglycosylase MltG [Streptomyces sp. APSN-46.1]MCJ1680907.1 endolytic transglycosylase MltG [Streptomyces sp. APSN-46.1]